MRQATPPRSRPATVVPDVVEEHFEELDFLWEQRESVIFAPDWDLDDLEDHEERCDAHLDGLVVAGEHALELVRPALAGEERGAATAAALLMLALSRPELDGEILEAFSTAEEPARDGIRIALRHGGPGGLAGGLAELARTGAPVVRVAALDVLAFHRSAPPPGLEVLLGSLEGPARGRLYPALGRFGGPWELRDLDRALAEDDPAAARCALETSARLGLDPLVERCRAALSQARPSSPAAVEFLGVVGDAADLRLLERALGIAELAVAAVRGMGALGTVEAVPVLLEAMSDPVLSVEAGAAFRRITGADGIEAEEPLPAPEGAGEDEFSEPVLPADPDRAGAWWNDERSRFGGSGLWQNGSDLSEDTLGPAFDALPLACRRDVYLGYRYGDPEETPELELEARARTQRRARRD